MTIEWEKNASSWIGTAKTDYPRFEAWRSDNPVDNRWCLNITRGQYVKPIEVRELQSLEAAKQFAEGALKELDYGSDSSLPVTTHCHAQETRMPCAAKSVT